MKIKKGFTLVELLMALIIVGVIAATVIPAVMGNLEKSKSAGSLSKAVEQIKLGCQNMIQADFEDHGAVNYSEGLDTLEDPQFGDASILRYMGAKVYNGTTTIHQFNGTNTTMPAGTKKTYRFQKFRADFTVIYSAIADPGNPSVDFAKIYIDTNGFDKKPNNLGKDVFIFTLMNNGNMVAEGLNDYETTCAKNAVTTGASCAARVIADNYRINYY